MERQGLTLRVAGRSRAVIAEGGAERGLDPFAERLAKASGKLPCRGYARFRPADRAVRKGGPGRRPDNLAKPGILDFVGASRPNRFHSYARCAFIPTCGDKSRRDGYDRCLPLRMLRPAPRSISSTRLANFAKSRAELSDIARAAINRAQVAAPQRKTPPGGDPGGVSVCVLSAPFRRGAGVSRR